MVTARAALGCEAARRPEARSHVLAPRARPPNTCKRPWPAPSSGRLLRLWQPVCPAWALNLRPLREAVAQASSRCSFLFSSDTRHRLPRPSRPFILNRSPRGQAPGFTFLLGPLILRKWLLC